MIRSIRDQRSWFNNNKRSVHQNSYLDFHTVIVIKMYLPLKTLHRKFTFIASARTKETKRRRVFVSIKLNFVRFSSKIIYFHGIYLREIILIPSPLLITILQRIPILILVSSRRKAFWTRGKEASILVL
jgi:hypothetical protein